MSEQILVDKKNRDAVEQALKDIYLKIEEETKKINGLLNTISTLEKRINELENMVRIHKAMSFGTGPSVK